VIVRRETLQAEFTSGHHQHVPVAEPRVNAQIPVFEPRLRVADERVRLFIGDVTRGMAADLPVFDTDQVDPHRHVILVEIDSQARGFEHAAPFGPVKQFGRVVAEHGEVGDGGSGLHSGADGPEKPGASFAGNPIHSRLFSDHQRRFAAQLGDGVIGHPIAKENYIFHSCQFETKNAAPKLTSSSPGGASDYSRG